MIKEYLLKCKQELFEKKIDLQKELQRNEIALKENMEFIRLIEDSEDKSYDSFSIKNYKNQMNEDKVKELKNQQTALNENNIYLNHEMLSLNNRIEELDQIIQVAKEKENIELQEHRNIENNEKIYELAVHQLASVGHKIELCERLVDVDKNRCMVELKNLSKIVNEVIEELNRFEI